MTKWLSVFLTVLIIAALPAVAQESPRVPIKGVFPDMTTMGGMDDPSEAAFGALIPWAGDLWAISYVSHIAGGGTGLYVISEEDGTLTYQKHPESVVGTFANRMLHLPSSQAIIGPHIIDQEGHVRTFDDLTGHRLTATCAHLEDPDNKVYFITMEGLLFEADVKTLEAKRLFNLNDELDIPPGATPHFKGAFSANGRLVVANNTYHEPEHLGERQGGCLAEWDGEQWTVLDRNPYVEVYGKGPRGGAYGNPIFAIGWDRASVILKLFTEDHWKTYRLPKGSHSFDHAWNTEWFRIREAQTERFLMDAHGIFYEMPAQIYENSIWGIKPIAYHLRIVPDFCFYKGLFVMAGNQTDLAVGQPQSGLWFGNIDDLWQFGKPQGWGGPWWETQVEAGQASDPFLMTGFDEKTLHLSHDADEAVNFTVEIDHLGNGTWHTYKKILVPANGYEYHVFPDGYSAHWVRIKVNKDCTATAHFAYH